MIDFRVGNEQTKSYSGHSTRCPLESTYLLGTLVAYKVIEGLMPRSQAGRFTHPATHRPR